MFEPKVNVGQSRLTRGQVTTVTSKPHFNGEQKQTIRVTLFLLASVKAALDCFYLCQLLTTHELSYMNWKVNILNEF